MRSPKSFVVAVRRFSGGLAVREQAWETLWPSLKFLRWPLFRGAIVLAESLHNGYSALKFSADHALPPEGTGTPPRPGPTALLATLLSSVMMAADNEPAPQGSKSSKGGDAMLLIATAMMVVFFIGLPHALTWLASHALGSSSDTSSVSFHLIDGVFRILILVGYVWMLSRSRDGATLFAYHGAEHKAIWAYEQYKPLTIDAATPLTTRHPRCGTSFLFIVVGVAVLLHVALLPFVPRLHANDFVNQVLMVFIKVPMAFPIAGIAYELQRWSARDSCPGFIKALTRPGIWLQSITTREPSPRQLEVALLSLDRALAREEGKPRGADGVTLYDSFAEAAG